jgi:gliding motility-associated-like protein
MKQILFPFILLALTSGLFGQNTTCQNPQPFCTGQTMQFPAGVNAGNAQAGPNYGCLGSQPNPAWFYFQAATSGPMVITMAANNDIDFICWGPFASLNSCGSLTSANQVPGSGYSNPSSNGCSYSGASTETLTIQNAVPGQFYILLITNFSNQNQQITFQQANATSPGAGQTNCGVLCSMTVTGTSSLCAGSTATVAVQTGTQIVGVAWSGPGGFASPSPNTSIPNMQSTGVYTAVATTTGTNPATNTCAVTKTITVVPTPTLTLGNNGPICAGLQANLTGAGATSYTWTGPGGFSSNIANPPIPNVQMINDGVYNVIGATNGCTSTASTTLTVKPNPTVTAANSGSYCVGQSFGLSTSGATTYTWTGPNNFTSNTQNPGFTNNIVGYSGTYSVVGATNGCTATASTNVVINPLPNITASSTGNVCETNSLTLSAAGGTAYAWTGPAGFVSFNSVINIPSANVAMSGTYNIVGTDANGCVNTASFVQTVFPNPVPVVMGDNSCINDILYLTASGGVSYEWTGPNGFTSSQQNPQITGVQPANAGLYTCTVTAAGGCFATSTAVCNVYNNPIIGFTGATEVCKGAPFQWVGTGGIIYKWLGTFGEIKQGNSFTVSSVSNQLQSTYTVVGTDGNGCSNMAVIYPVVYGLPYGFVVPEKEGGCVPFAAKLSTTGMAPNIVTSQWVFDNGATFQDSAYATYVVSTPGIHTVNIKLTDSRGCKSTISNTVEGYPVPKADFTYTPDSPNENDYQVTFTDETKNAPIVSWYWDFYSNSQNISFKQNPTYSFPEIGNYFVFLKVRSNKNCVDSIVKKLEVVEDPTFYIPNSFTPNGDNINDTFSPKGVGIKKYKMEIFDRWGALLYTTTDITMGWDGRYKSSGDFLPVGVYIYKISVILNNGSKPKQYTGHVSILR